MEAGEPSPDDSSLAVEGSSAVLFGYGLRRVQIVFGGVESLIY